MHENSGREVRFGKRAHMESEAQAKADEGIPVLIVGTTGSYFLAPSKAAVDVTLNGIEFASWLGVN